MTTLLTGRTALVTGAGRGIGRAVALGLAEAGVTVALVARSRDELAETADQVKEMGGDALVVPADLGDPLQVASIIELTTGELGPVGILINNAAVVWPLGPSVQVKPAEWGAALQVNAVAPAVLTFALLPAMLEAKWGRIVNVSSGIAARPGAMVGMNAYATSKAALEAHNLNLAAELSCTGVTVNAFRPGSVDTAMQAWIRAQDPTKIGAALHERFEKSHAAGTLITPGASARSLLDHLSSDGTGNIWEAAQPGG
jgi:NAD(P)-dependent dehydrogenase (short-subunit alcohol dehydrogenase family)